MSHNRSRWRFADGGDPGKATMERERKFLITQRPPRLAAHRHKLIEQGYLVMVGDSNEIQVRIRRSEGRYELTLKRGSAEARLEVELPLSPTDARQLWPLTRGRRVVKMRYEVPLGKLTAEVDICRGNARGLMVAEVEFSSAAALRRFRPPGWFGEEITGRGEYSNSRLAVHGWKPRG
jgi:CYTH domain-containing protein